MHKSASKIALDLGSAQTKIALGGQSEQQPLQVIFHQPTCLAWHRRTHEVVAIGQAAADLMGKTPPQIEVVFPVRHGKIYNLLAVQIYLRICLRTILKQHLPTRLQVNFSHVFHPTIVMAVPFATSMAEKEMLRKMFREIGFSHVQFINQMQAAYQNLQKQKKVGRVFALANIGAMTTEMAFFAQGEIVAQRSLNFGGDDFTNLVQHEVQTQHHCQIGWLTAEKAKMTLGVDLTNQKNKKMMVRGRDILTSLPTTVQMTAAEATPSYESLINDLIQQITDLFQDVAPEIVAEGLDQGMMFTGGGSLLDGLATVVEARLRAPIHLSQTAVDDVVQGIWQIVIPERGT